MSGITNVMDCLDSLASELLQKRDNHQIYLQLLQELSEHIQRTSQIDDQFLRKTLMANHRTIFNKIEKILQIPSFQKEDPTILFKIRLLRGVIIFLRNVLAGSTTKIISDFHSFYDAILQLHQLVLAQLLTASQIYFKDYAVIDSTFLITKLLPCYFQCLINLSGNFKGAIKVDPTGVSNLDISTRENEYKDIIRHLNKIVQLDRSCSFFSDRRSGASYELFLMYLNHFIINNYLIVNHEVADIDEDEVTNNFLYYLLNDPDTSLVDWLTENFITFYHDHNFLQNPEPKGKIQEINEHNDEHEKDTFKTFLTFSSIFRNIIIHESFGKFLLVNWKAQNQQITLHSLQISQILLTNLKFFSNFKLAVILTWILDIFNQILETTQKYFSDNRTIDVSYLNGCLFIVLDILSHMLTFNYSVQYLNNYKFLEKLNVLLQLLHNNIEPISKLSDISNESELNDPKKFPNIKKMTIESMTYLIYNNYENQELMRTMHALEIVLSSCVIDRLNPFIKETSIVCIRYLLENNKENQDFVRKLEAKKVVNEDDLKENGIELEMKEGKVKFKKGDTK